MNIPFTAESLAEFVKVADETYTGNETEFTGQVMFDIRLKPGYVRASDSWLCCNFDREGAVALRDHLNKILGE